jgi:hypothetical protein
MVSDKKIKRLFVRVVSFDGVVERLAGGASSVDSVLDCGFFVAKNRGGVLFNFVPDMFRQRVPFS